MAAAAAISPAAGGDQRRPSPAPPAGPWLAVRYPPAPAILMPHQMMPPPHFAAAPPPAFHRHQSPAPKGRQDGGGDEENRTIWVGDLDYWMDENYLYSCFAHTGEIAAIKLIRNKHTGQSEGYGFVEFHTHEAAEGTLQNLNGHIMPNTDHQFRLNWASFGMGEKRPEVVLDHSIFVGDLASDVTDVLLQEVFANKYGSVKGAKVVIDANTGRSKGYGFVRFGDENEKKLALTEMNGVYCSTRPMRIGLATPRKFSGTYGSNNGSPTPGHQSDGDSSNTTVFVGGLGPDVSEDDLKKTFSEYGDVASVKIPAGKQCGFVLFVHRNSAEEALQQLNGKAIGKQTVRLSWGRNPANKQSRPERGNWNGGVYYGRNYGGYAYALPPHYPGMYAPAYGAYAMYGNQQQVS